MKAEREVIKTKDLFTFELELGVGEARPAGQQLEDVLYNCLDFCLLYRKQAHFFLKPYSSNSTRLPLLVQLTELYPVDR